MDPAPWYVGLRRPPYFADVASGIDTEVLAVDLAGREAAGVPVTVVLTQVQWHSVRRAEGQGFYTWTNGKAQKHAAGEVPAGLAQRLVGPYVEEAKEALADHIVADADLVDAGAIFGTGFAPFRGGPLHYAQSLA